MRVKFPSPSRFCSVVKQQWSVPVVESAPSAMARQSACWCRLGR
jgi:hypothetical protein